MYDRSLAVVLGHVYRAGTNATILCSGSDLRKAKSRIIIGYFFSKRKSNPRPSELRSDAL